MKTLLLQELPPGTEGFFFSYMGPDVGTVLIHLAQAGVIWVLAIGLLAFICLHLVKSIRAGNVQQQTTRRKVKKTKGKSRDQLMIAESTAEVIEGEEVPARKPENAEAPSKVVKVPNLDESWIYDHLPGGNGSNQLGPGQKAKQVQPPKTNLVKRKGDQQDPPR